MPHPSARSCRAFCPYALRRWRIATVQPTQHHRFPYASDIAPISVNGGVPPLPSTRNTGHAHRPTSSAAMSGVPTTAGRFRADPAAASPPDTAALRKIVGPLDWPVSTAGYSHCQEHGGKAEPLRARQGSAVKPSAPDNGRSTAIASAPGITALGHALANGTDGVRRYHTPAKKTQSVLRKCESVRCGADVGVGSLTHRDGMEPALNLRL